MSVHIIVLGKLKDEHLKALESSFLKRIVSLNIAIHELKAFSEDKNIEAQRVSKKLSGLSQKSKKLYTIALTEKGKQYDSVSFSKNIFKRIEESFDIVFIIGGALGLDHTILSESSENLSLGKLTFPHKFARLFLIEQLYRAYTIYNNHPYHNS